MDLFIAELEGCGGNTAIEKQRHGAEVFFRVLKVNEPGAAFSVMRLLFFFFFFSFFSETETVISHLS